MDDSPLLPGLQYCLDTWKQGKAPFYSLTTQRRRHCVYNYKIDPKVHSDMCNSCLCIKRISHWKTKIKHSPNGHLINSNMLDHAEHAWADWWTLG
jgi:hypothetical protein